MAEAKTKKTQASVADYLAAITDEERRRDCEAIAKLMKKVTKKEARMWGAAIVGFGAYKYTYESGHSGESCLVGFSPRKDAISVYLAPALPGLEEKLARLGKHKMGKGCLYVKRLRDVDLAVLEELVKSSVAEITKRHGAAPEGD